MKLRTRVSAVRAGNRSLAILAACTLPIFAQDVPAPAGDAADPDPAETPDAKIIEVPNVLDGLEKLQIAPANPWDSADVFAGPPNPFAAPKGAGPTPLEAPDNTSGALPLIDNPPLDTPSAEVPAPALNAELAVPPPDASSQPPQFPNESPQNQPLSSLAAPNFLTAKRSFPIGAGRVRYGVQIDTAGAYNNNVFGTASNRQGDFIFSLQPSFYLETGKKAEVRFLWAPSVLKYARFKKFDSVNQTFLFSSRYRLTKLQLGLDASYAAQSGLFLNSQGQAKQKTAFARIFASYPLTSKTSLNAALSGTGYQTDPGGSSFSGSFSTSIDYKHSRKTTIGAGVTVGYYGATGSSTTYQTFLLRLLYNPTARLTFRADGGITFRQSQTNGSASTAVMNFLMSYRPTDKTTLTARLSRSLDMDSFAPGGLQIVTTAQAGIALQLSDRVNVDGSIVAGYSESTSPDGGSFFFNQANVSLSYAILQDVNLRVFNSLQQRLRDTEGGNYISNTSGMSLGMRF